MHAVVFGSLKVQKVTASLSAEIWNTYANRKLFLRRSLLLFAHLKNKIPAITDVQKLITYFSEGNACYCYDNNAARGGGLWSSDSPGSPSMPCSTVQVADGHVEMVDAFVYLGSTIDSSGVSRGEVLRRIGIARSCMNLLEKKKILENTKIRLYQTYIVPILLYGCETWSTTKLQCSRIDAFDMWALRKILRIPYTHHVTNVEVRGATTGCHPLSHLVTDSKADPQASKQTNRGDYNTLRSLAPSVTVTVYTGKSDIRNKE